MSMTHNLINDAVRDIQHATGAIRRLSVLARMGAIPDRDHYRTLHEHATTLNRAFKDLIQALKAQNAYTEDSPNPT